MADTLDIRSEQRGQILVISVAGSLDALTASQAKDYIGTQFEGGQRRIVLDLGQVDFMSSSGIRVLLELLKVGRGLGGDLRVAAPQPGVQRTLEISGLVRVLSVSPSVAEAVRSFEPSD